MIRIEIERHLTDGATTEEYKVIRLFGITLYSYQLKPIRYDLNGSRISK